MNNMQINLRNIRNEIINDLDNHEFTFKNIMPLYVASPQSKVLIIGQAPGQVAQDTKVIWDDASGAILREWLGVVDSQFYDHLNFSFLPMDFYYPGKNESGDLPPRKDFAKKWHPRILENLPNIELIILVGQHAQRYYLKKNMKKNLTQTVLSYKEYLPKYFPIPHPSPANFRWQLKNPWFIDDTIKDLRQIINEILF